MLKTQLPAVEESSKPPLPFLDSISSLRASGRTRGMSEPPPALEENSPRGSRAVRPTGVMNILKRSIGGESGGSSTLRESSPSSRPLSPSSPLHGPTTVSLNASPLLTLRASVDTDAPRPIEPRSPLQSSLPPTASLEEPKTTASDSSTKPSVSVNQEQPTTISLAQSSAVTSEPKQPTPTITDIRASAGEKQITTPTEVHRSEEQDQTLTLHTENVNRFSSLIENVKLQKSLKDLITVSEVVSINCEVFFVVKLS